MWGEKMAGTFMISRKYVLSFSLLLEIVLLFLKWHRDDFFFFLLPFESAFSDITKCLSGRAKKWSEGWWTPIITVWVRQQYRHTMQDTGDTNSIVAVDAPFRWTKSTMILSDLSFDETVRIAEATYFTSHARMHYVLDCTNWAERVCLQCICWLKANVVLPAV